MSLIIPPGFGQAVFNFSWAGDSEPMVSTLGCDLSGVGGDYQGAVDNLHTAFGDNVVPNLADVVTLTHVTLYVGQDGTTTIPFDSTNPPVSGVADGTSLPSNTAFLVRKRTDLGGRRGRGRMYLPGCGESVVNNLGQVDTTFAGVLQAGLDDFQSGMAAIADPVTFVVLHRSEGAGVEPPPTPITLLQLDPVVATQRQRLRR